MKQLRILNLYAGLGGNRYLWDNCQITAIEHNTNIANVYKSRFPNDRLIIGDAHSYLLSHYKEFDFIWSSPPCTTHSRARYAGFGATLPKYADMTLYEEILFLKHYFTGFWVVENVIPYYTPLIPGQYRGSHIYWSNFFIPHQLTTRTQPNKSDNLVIDKLCAFHQIGRAEVKSIPRKDQVLRNMLDYEIGATILTTAKQAMSYIPPAQGTLFSDIG